MADELTTSTLDDLYEDIIAEAQFTAVERSLMRNLVTTYDASGTSGKVFSVPKYPAVTAAAVAEATDLSNTSVSTSEATMTLGEHGVMVTLTDFSRDTSVRDVAADIGRTLGEAIAKRMDQDIIALFTGFSTDKGAGTSSEITLANLFAAQATLRNSAAPDMDNASVVLHPYQAYQLKSVLTNTYGGSTNNVPDNDALQSGFVGRIAGMNVYESANITVDASGDAIGAAFVPAALGLAIRNEFKLEYERDASLRATEIVATGVWGEGELFDAYGVKLSTDATI